MLCVIYWQTAKSDAIVVEATTRMETPTKLKHVKRACRQMRRWSSVRVGSTFEDDAMSFGEM
jgi:hypothetical protein